MPDSGPFNLAFTYLRLRSDAAVEPLAVDATFWQRLSAGELGSFHHEFLVSCHAFDADWTIWEMHPKGDEIVCLLSGAVVLLLERGSEYRAIELEDSGDYALVPRGTWHTARVRAPSRMLFITAGEETQHRPAI